MKRKINCSTESIKQEILSRYNECKEDMNKYDDEYSSGFCDAVELLNESLNLKLIKSRKSNNSKMYDFSKVNNMHLGGEDQYGFVRRTLSVEEIQDLAVSESNRGIYGSKLEGDLDSRYLLITASTSYSHTGYTSFIFNDDLNLIRQQFNNYLDSAQSKPNYVRLLAVVVDLEDRLEIAYKEAQGQKASKAYS